MGDRCTGHCCQRFYLPYSPWELDDIARKVVARAEFSKVWAASLPPLNVDDRSTWKPMPIPIPAELQGPNVEDIVQIASMVEHVATEADGHCYRCKNLQSDGNCGIYAHRPRMCREYPYGRACCFGACTWDAAREGAGGRHHLITTRGESLTVHLRVLQERGGVDLIERVCKPDA